MLMKKRVSYSLLLLITLMALSCTEEISEEIQNSSSSSSSSDSDVDFTTKSIRLVHKMDDELSYVMHKAGDYESDCELQAPSAGFDADDYDYTDKNYAIDCVLDVEELDLVTNGLELEFQVDDYLCEYVEYKPYSALRFQPGKTTRIVYEVECDAACEENSSIKSLCGNTYDEFYGAIGTVDMTPDGTEVGNQIPDLGKMCFYDYESRLGTDSDDFSYPNCDEGFVRTYKVQYLESGDPASCVAVVANSEYDESDCGGNRYACLDGAIKESDLNYLEGEKSVTSVNTGLDDITIEVSYDEYFEDENYFGSSKLANYSRICANTDDIKTNDSVISSTITLLGWQSEDIRKYDEDLYGNTNSNYGWYNDAIVEDSPGGDFDGWVEATDWADNLFRGAVPTQPYYSFGCYDKAFDIKAQIRLFIRDWDRKFTDTNITMNANSDVYLEEDALMDTRDEEQPGGGGLDTYWNDQDDLDDFFEDNNVWDQNECVESSVPWSDNNFPGRSQF